MRLCDDIRVLSPVLLDFHGSMHLDIYLFQKVFLFFFFFLWRSREHEMNDSNLVSNFTFFLLAVNESHDRGMIPTQTQPAMKSRIQDPIFKIQGFLHRYT